MTDTEYCPCGYRGGVTSKGPPFWKVNGQIWHWGCLVKTHPEMRETLEAKKKEALAKTTIYEWTTTG